MKENAAFLIILVILFGGCVATCVQLKHQSNMGDEYCF